MCSLLKPLRWKRPTKAHSRNPHPIATPAVISYEDESKRLRKDIERLKNELQEAQGWCHMSQNTAALCWRLARDGRQPQFSFLLFSPLIGLAHPIDDGMEKVELGEYLSLQAAHARLERELQSLRSTQGSRGTPKRVALRCLRLCRTSWSSPKVMAPCRGPFHLSHRALCYPQLKWKRSCQVCGRSWWVALETHGCRLLFAAVPTHACRQPRSFPATALQRRTHARFAKRAAAAVGDSPQGRVLAGLCSHS